jgi:hypothetical protein
MDTLLNSILQLFEIKNLLKNIARNHASIIAPSFNPNLHHPLFPCRALVAQWIAALLSTMHFFLFLLAAANIPAINSCSASVAASHSSIIRTMALNNTHSSWRGDLWPRNISSLCAPRSTPPSPCPWSNPPAHRETNYSALLARTFPNNPGKLRASVVAS